MKNFSVVISSLDSCTRNWHRCWGKCRRELNHMLFYIEGECNYLYNFMGLLQTFISAWRWEASKIFKRGRFFLSSMQTWLMELLTTNYVWGCCKLVNAFISSANINFIIDFYWKFLKLIESIDFSLTVVNIEFWFLFHLMLGILLNVMLWFIHHAHFYEI